MKKFSKNPLFGFANAQYVCPKGIMFQKMSSIFRWSHEFELMSGTYNTERIYVIIRFEPRGNWCRLTPTTTVGHCIHQHHANIQRLSIVHHVTGWKPTKECQGRHEKSSNLSADMLLGHLKLLKTVELRIVQCLSLKIPEKSLNIVNKHVFICSHP